MTRDELYSLMHDLVVAVTGLPGNKVVKANQIDDTAPAGEYATVNVQGSKQRGQAIIRRSNTALVASPIGQVHNVAHDIRPQVLTDIAINFFRGNALDHAADVFEANKRPDISAMLFAAGAGWVQAGPINDLTALQSARWEPRAQITVTLAHERITAATTNAIYSASVEVEDEDGDTLTTITTEAPAGA